MPLYKAMLTFHDHFSIELQRTNSAFGPSEVDNINQLAI